MTVSVAEEWAALVGDNRRLLAENERMRQALEEVALRTVQRDLNKIAHLALGHQPNPHTVRLLAELEQEARR